MAWKKLPRIVTHPMLHPRLLRLNQDLASDKRVDHVYATHGTYRIRIRAERVSEVPRKHLGPRDYRLTATFDGRVFTVHGMFPSQAFGALVNELTKAIDDKLSKSNVVSMPERHVA